MRNIFTYLILSLALSSCDVWIGKTAADTALPGANSVRLITPELLQPGHIYKIKKGAYTELCSSDINEQTALKAVTVKAEKPSPDVVSDQALFSDAEISAFGIKLGPAYQIVKVTGFQIFSASAPSSNSVTGYILANLKNGKSGTCARDVLPRNMPYIVVEATVVAQKADVTNVRSLTLGGKVGPLSGALSAKDTPDSTRTDVVFGAKGLLVTR